MAVTSRADSRAAFLCGFLLTVCAATGVSGRTEGFAPLGSLVVSNNYAGYTIIRSSDGKQLAIVDLSSQIGDDYYASTASTPDGRYLFSTVLPRSGPYHYVVTALGATAPKVLGKLAVQTTAFGDGCSPVQRGTAITKHGNGYRLFVTLACSTTTPCKPIDYPYNATVLRTVALDYTLGASGRLGSLKQATKPLLLLQSTVQRCASAARGYSVRSNVPLLTVDAPVKNVASKALNVYEVLTSTSTVGGKTVESLSYKLTYTVATPFVDTSGNNFNVVIDAVAATPTSVYLSPSPRLNSPSKVFYYYGGKTIAAKGGPPHTDNYPFTPAETGYNYNELAGYGSTAYATIDYQKVTSDNKYSASTQVLRITDAQLLKGEQGTIIKTLPDAAFDLTTVGSA